MKDFAKKLYSIKHATNIRALHDQIDRVSFKNDDPADWKDSVLKLVALCDRLDLEIEGLKDKGNEAAQKIYLLRKAIDKAESFDH